METYLCSVSCSDVLLIDQVIFLLSDLAEDPDVKQKILDLKDELETHRASRSKDHIRNRRVNTRG